MLSEIQQIIARDDPPAIYYMQRQWTTVPRSDIEEFVFNPINIGTFNFYTMSLSPVCICTLRPATAEVGAWNSRIGSPQTHSGVISSTTADQAVGCDNARSPIPAATPAGNGTRARE